MSIFIPNLAAAELPLFFGVTFNCLTALCFSSVSSRRITTMLSGRNVGKLWHQTAFVGK